MDSPMTTQPDPESLAQAAALLPCDKWSQCKDGKHVERCAFHKRPIVAAALAELRAEGLRLMKERDIASELANSKDRAMQELREHWDAVMRVMEQVEADRDSLRAAVLQAFGSTRTHSEAWAKLSPLFDAGAQGRRIIEEARAKGEGS
jgi:hypothetical protein